MLNLIPTIVLSVLVLAAIPVWPWSKGWGWAPFGMLAMGLGTLLLFTWSVTPA